MIRPLAEHETGLIDRITPELEELRTIVANMTPDMAFDPSNWIVPLLNAPASNMEVALDSLHMVQDAQPITILTGELAHARGTVSGIQKVFAQFPSNEAAVGYGGFIEELMTGFQVELDETETQRLLELAMKMLNSPIFPPHLKPIVLAFAKARKYRVDAEFVTLDLIDQKYPKSLLDIPLRDVAETVSIYNYQLGIFEGIRQGIEFVALADPRAFKEKDELLAEIHEGWFNILMSR